MENEAFLYIQTLLKKYGKDQNMKNDGNDGYYTIMSQAIPNLYGGDVFGPQSNIQKVIKI
jgi:hypothetical protein